MWLSGWYVLANSERLRDSRLLYYTLTLTLLFTRLLCSANAASSSGGDCRRQANVQGSCVYTPPQYPAVTVLSIERSRSDVSRCGTSSLLAVHHKQETRRCRRIVTGDRTMSINAPTQPPTTAAELAGGQSLASALAELATNSIPGEEEEKIEEEDESDSEYEKEEPEDVDGSKVKKGPYGDKRVHKDGRSEYFLCSRGEPRFANVEPGTPSFVRAVLCQQDLADEVSMPGTAGFNAWEWMKGVTEEEWEAVKGIQLAPAGVRLMAALDDGEDVHPRAF